MEITQGKLISFEMTPTVKGVGRICGIATTGAPVIGRSIIIEIVQSDGIDKAIYPFTHAVVFECQITGEVRDEREDR